MLRTARKDDAEKLSRIHLSELHSDFLPSLGLDFLTHLYRDFIKFKEVEVIVFDSKNKISGFIVGAKDFNSIFKTIILNNFFTYASLLILKMITRPIILKNVFDTLIYPVKEWNGIKSELVVIAVSNECQRKGIGRKLLNELEIRFKKREIMEYKVSVNKKNKRANLFYKSLGFRKIREFYLYNKKLNLLVKNI